MRVALLVGMLALGTLWAAPAAAHPRPYIGGTGDVVVVCGDDFKTGIGGVCLDAGEIQGGFFGAEVWIMDGWLYPNSGRFCQDVDGNGGCEINTAFCGGLQLIDGWNWDSSRPATVFVDGPLFGNALLSTCFSLASPGVHGVVWHS